MDQPRRSQPKGSAQKVRGGRGIEEQKPCCGRKETKNKKTERKKKTTVGGGKSMMRRAREHWARVKKERKKIPLSKGGKRHKGEQQKTKPWD